MLATVERLEPVYSSVLYELSSLLKGAVERKEDGLPVDLLDTALARANAVWAACAAHEKALPEAAENWVTVAINRTTGYLLDFYFEALRLLWPNRGQEQVRIQLILQALETAIDGESPASEVARILVAAKAGLLAEIAQDWYSEHVLPLLATPASARCAEQSWDGYLVWGSWTQAMLPGLIPAHMRHLPQINGSVEQSVSHVLRSSGWLRRIRSNRPHRKRLARRIPHPIGASRAYALGRERHPDLARSR